MKTKSETVVFFGSGPVAARSLELLLQNFAVELVITKPRPAHHKGPVPVLETAQKHGLPVETVSTKKELDALVAARPARSRVGILIDFGIIVSQEVIDYFELGIINSHFSLLPEWRGADPITFAVLSGQKKTGVSLMLLVAAMDEGPLLAVGEYELPAEITTPALTEGLIELSDALLREILPAYLSGDLRPMSQDQAAELVGISPNATYSRKLSKQDGVLDLHKPAGQLAREIRAFIEWPKSRLTIGDIDVIVTAAHAVPGDSGQPGDIQVDIHAGTLHCQCGEGQLAITRLKPAGKREMSIAEFISGYRSRLR